MIEGHVKWYDPVKGYGFVVPDDGGGDVMVHASCVRAFGRGSLPEGARIKLIGMEGKRGLQAQEILEVEESTVEPIGSAADQFRPTDLIGEAQRTGPLLPARVKWFDKQKGFGFVNVFGHPDDIFIHMEIVRRYGFPDLLGGQGVAVRTFDGPRGQMVSELQVWEAGVVHHQRAAAAE